MHAMVEEQSTTGRATDVDRAVSRALKDMSIGVLTTADLARAIGKPYQTVDNYIEGRRAMPIPVVIDMAKALDVRLDAVFRRAGLQAETVSVEEAIDSDARLPNQHRAAVKAIYRTFLGL